MKAILLTLVSLAACTGGERNSANAAERTILGGAPIESAPADTYQVRVGGAVGHLGGMLEVDSAAPAFSAQISSSPVAAAQAATARCLPALAAATGVAGAVVWIADIREGKALPPMRRADLVSQGCRLAPRVQGAITGGALNVRTVDAAPHELRFVRLSDDDTLARVAHAEDRAVVPVDAVLRAPGHIAVRCLRHPGEQAWVIVLDHPYMTTPDGTGAFEISDLPAGTYSVLAWHERFGQAAARVSVRAGERAFARLKFGTRS